MAGSNGMLGTYPVLIKVSLGLGLLGLVLPLKSTSEDTRETRVNEVLDMMANARDEYYGWAPTEVLKELEESINLIQVCSTEEETRQIVFQSVIPLRMAKDRRNFYAWDHEKCEWCLKGFNTHFMHIHGTTVMLIVEARNEADFDDAIQMRDLDKLAA